VDTPVRSPLIVACADNVRLAAEPVWVDCPLEPGAYYRLRALTEGAEDTGDLAGLVQIQVADPSAGGEGVRMTPKIGAHLYLRSGPGMHGTDRLFTVASPGRRLGIMVWGNRGEPVLRSLTVERAGEEAGPAEFFFSFDVEAGLHRARERLIDTLVWGRMGGGEYGIARICDVLEQHGVRGNFLIDYATCLLDGERGLRDIVDHLAGRGHEIHLHLHPDQMGHAWGLKVAQGRSNKLDGAPYDLSRRLLDFTVGRHEQFVGAPPRLFRSGSYRMNPDLVLAAGALGIEALSNVTRDVLADPEVGGDLVREREPFVWDNGVLEIPVDYSSPEAGTFEAFLDKYRLAMRRKRHERTFNLVMHSYSLTLRDEEGFHVRYQPAYEERLHQMCEHAMRHGRAYGYGEWLDGRRVARPTVPLTHIRTVEPPAPVYVASTDVVTCGVCRSVFALSRSDGDGCPACGLGLAQRHLADALANAGNVFDGRRVLADRITPALRRHLLRGAVAVAALGTVGATLADVGDAAFDCFLGPTYLAEQDDDDDGAAAEIARILAPGGVFVSMEPSGTGPLDPSTVGVGAPDEDPGYRGLVRDGHTQILSAHFRTSWVPGYDRVTRTTRRVALAYRA
jgi:SAM-dependent methyltransferase